MKKFTELRTLYDLSKGRSVSKQLNALDPHCINFIGHSPFIVIASGGAKGMLDASPRGGSPGCIRVLNETTLLIPDTKGNNRLDTLNNIVSAVARALVTMAPMHVAAPLHLTRTIP